MRNLVLLALAAALLAGSPARAAPQSKPEAVLKTKGYASAIKILDRDHDRMVDEIIKLTEIPAPPFKEAARAAAYAEMLKDAGLQDVEIDAEGNAMGVYRGTGPAGGPAVLIAAHLDTADMPPRSRSAATAPAFTPPVSATTPAAWPSCSPMRGR